LIGGGLAAPKLGRISAGARPDLGSISARSRLRHARLEGGGERRVGVANIDLAAGDVPRPA